MQYSVVLRIKETEASQKQFLLFCLNHFHRLGIIYENKRKKKLWCLGICGTSLVKKSNRDDPGTGLSKGIIALL